MKCTKFIFGAIIYTLIFPSSVLAVASDFTIRTYVGNDTTPPTTPILQSVIPVASTQIDVAWFASTDDVTVAGYRLFRDGLQIATTTLLSYSDIGLTSSTLYSYTVDAFDTYGNFSSTSVSMATTTLANLPPVATSTPTSTSGGTSGTRTAPVLVDLMIETKQTSALFTWETSGPTKYTLVWGRTSSHELGSVSGVLYGKNHIANITSLEPGTIYYYELQAIDLRGEVMVISSGSFTTKSSVTGELLPNVQGLAGRTQGNDVELSWRNTFSNPDYFVRVVRSHLFYPNNIQNGAVVYEGRAESFIDAEALLARSPQYYTIFVLDGTGAVSSGAIVRVSKVGQGAVEIIPNGSSSTEGITNIPPDMGDDAVLRAADITIVQNEKMHSFDNGLTLDINVSYLISVPYDSVAKNLKTIIVSVQNPTNQREVSAYLLKLNQAGDAYIARVQGSPVVGTAQVMVEVFDYELETVRRISTTISFVNAELPTPFFPDKIILYSPYLVPPIILTGFWFWLLLLWRRRKSKNK